MSILEQLQKSFYNNFLRFLGNSIPVLPKGATTKLFLYSYLLHKKMLLRMHDTP